VVKRKTRNKGNTHHTPTVPRAAFAQVCLVVSRSRRPILDGEALAATH
jgi:hypothetical protein